MENLKAPQVDLRQSEKWARYLSTLGWKSFKTSKKINIEIKKLIFTSVVKIQHPKKLDKKDLEEIEGICKKNKALFIKIEPNYNQKIEILEKKEYTKSYFPLLPPTTIFIDLTKNEQELWEAISKSGKYSINRAKREEFKIKTFQNPTPEILREYCEIEKQSPERKGVYVGSYEDLLKKREIFGDECFLILVYNKKDKLTGGNFYLAHKDTVWFMHGGSTHSGRKGKGGYALVWESFLYFKKLGYKILDLEGKDDDRFPTFTKNWGGFSHFKEKFGGIIIENPHPYIKPLRPILKLLRMVYGTLPL